MKYIKKLIGHKCYLSPGFIEDVPLFTRWINDLAITTNLTMPHECFSQLREEELVKKMLTSGEHFYEIIDLETETPIGCCGLHDIDHINRKASLGIFIGEKEFQSKGYGTEAVKLLLEYGFQYINLNNIMLSVFSFNDKALGCYKKCGFREIGRRRQVIMRERKAYDEIYMDMLSSEFSW